MLPVVYGSFLRSSERNKAKYELSKPLLSQLSNAFVMFAVAGFAVSGCFFCYENFLNIPTRNYDVNMYTKYQKLNNDLLKDNKQIITARTGNLDVIKAINNFVKARQNDKVVFTALDVSGDKYTLNAQVKALPDGDKFIKELDFGAEKTVTLGKVTTKENFIDFTVVVTDKPKVKTKGKGANAKKGGK